MTIRRDVLVVLVIIALAILVSCGGLVAAYLLATRGPTVAPGSALLVRVSGDLEEVTPGGVVGHLLVGRPTLRGLAETLRKAKVDPRIAGVVLAPAGATALWGKLQELREAVVDFKRSGKPIVAFLEFGGAREYYLATACDRIVLAPASPLDLTGLAVYEVFLRGLLDKVGVYPDLLHIGEYKTAPNLFTERGLTPAHREMLESLTGDLFEQLLRAVAEGRGKSLAEVRGLLDQGPFLPEEALRVGLVDELAYEDELDDKAPLDARRVSWLDEREYRSVGLAELGLGRGPRIAVIYGIGLIVSGESRFDGGGGPVLGAQTFIAALRQVRADPSIRAIVLRIDSPGGSFVASDLIWREVLLTRAEKPVIASLSDVAASGGYYIAMPAHTIVAQPGTLTGSIGVYAGKFAVGKALERLGVGVASVSRGLRAEMYSPVRPFTPAERSKLEEQLQAVYDEFVEKAARARGTTPERLDRVAQGRVWTGRQGRQVGLVDELGGLDRAIGIAKARAGIPADADVEIVVYPQPRGLSQWIADLVGQAGHAAAPFWWASGEPRTWASLEPRAMRAMGAPLQLFRRGEPLALMPLVFLR